MNWIKLAGVLLLALSPAALAWTGGTASTIGGKDDGGPPVPPPVVVPLTGCAALNKADCAACCFDEYAADQRTCDDACTTCKLSLLGLICVATTTNEECFATCTRNASKTADACYASCPP